MRYVLTVHVQAIDAVDADGDLAVLEALDYRFDNLGTIATVWQDVIDAIENLL